MPDLKAKTKTAGVQVFLQSLDDPQQRDDAFQLLELMRRITGLEPELWGSGIIGFGRRLYQGKSGASEWFLTGFAPRKGNLSIYIISGFDAHSELMASLGKYKTGKACLYVKGLSDIDLEVLEALIRAEWEHRTAG